jgi:beta-glucosidase-like glycosyl hydrolase
MRRSSGLILLLCAAVLHAAPGKRAPIFTPELDRDAQKWVDRTLKNMTLDQKVGQVLVTTFDSTYVSSDSDEFERLARAVREHHVGGVVVFGRRSVPTPGVLLNPAYFGVTLGDALGAASMLNRLQRLAAIPLLNAADFENGPGFRLEGTTRFPRMMAFGAAGDERLVRTAASITAREARALGVHVNLAPVADVNNNPRNPVINTRSFGSSPATVGRMVAAYVTGTHEGGALSTLKHFPGHGDTEVDSHIGFPVMNHSRERLDQIELVPFRAGVAAGADAVMSAHVTLPLIDPQAPGTLSGAVPRLLRDGLTFQGLILTDAMTMDGIAKLAGPGEAVARAFSAGHDMILEPPDEAAASAALKAAVEKGDITRDRLDASVRRILVAKARLGLHRQRFVDLETTPTIVGTRQHAKVAEEASRRSITLVKDVAGVVPLTVPRTASILYLSVLDYPAGWGVAAPSRVYAPELRKLWPDVTAVEISDRSTANELELLRTTAPRYDAIVAAVFVRVSSGSGRLDLTPSVIRVLQNIARTAQERGQPMVATFFGSPYVPAALAELPAIMLTYDLYDGAEAAAVRALSGEAPISGRLPIPIPGLADIGAGLDRPGRTGSQGRAIQALPPADVVVPIPVIVGAVRVRARSSPS